MAYSLTFSVCVCEFPFWNIPDSSRVKSILLRRAHGIVLRNLTVTAYHRLVHCMYCRKIENWYYNNTNQISERNAPIRKIRSRVSGRVLRYKNRNALRPSL